LISRGGLYTFTFSVAGWFRVRSGFDLAAPRARLVNGRLATVLLYQGGQTVVDKSAGGQSSSIVKTPDPAASKMTRGSRVDFFTFRSKSVFFIDVGRRRPIDPARLAKISFRFPAYPFHFSAYKKGRHLMKPLMVMIISREMKDGNEEIISRVLNKFIQV